MNVRARLPAMTCLILLICVVAVAAMGGREDPLVQADVLIEQQKYDEAILYLTDFMKQYPDRFDAAQSRLRKISKIRSAYNERAAELLEVLVNEPTNEEKKLRMIAELEAFEKNPNPAVRDFVKKTKDLALFTYNRAQFELIMSDGRGLIDSRRFAEAARRYEEGFALYRPEFLEMGLSQDFIDDAFARVASVSGSIIAFESGNTGFSGAFDELALLAGASDADYSDAWLRARDQASLYATMRIQVVEDGRALEAAFERLSEKDATITENSFLPFAFRLVLGRKTESQLEGVAGAMDAAWTGALGRAQTALDEVMTKGSGVAEAAYGAGDWEQAVTAWDGVAQSTRRASELLALWGTYVQTDLVDRATSLGQAVLELKGADFLRYQHLGRVARAYSSLAALNLAMDTGAAGLAAWDPTPLAVNDAIAGYIRQRADFVELKAGVEAVRDASGFAATALAEAVASGYGNETSQVMQGQLDGRIGNTALRAGELETKTVAALSAYRYGLLARDAETALARLELGRTEYEGSPSDDPLLPNAVFRFPGRAITTLGGAIASLDALLRDIDAFVESFRSEPDFIAANATVLEWAERARTLAVRARASAADAGALRTYATEQKRLADSSRLEAERRITESRSALRAGNFETARERLERARERYLTSLTYEQDPLLRAQSDRILSEIASAILKAENDLVVAETRKLLTSGKKYYLDGDFERAEAILLQARARWAVTNTTSEVEVEYWLKLVQTAMSVKTGRDIPITAPLFPEMSQLLSLARRYYDEGSALLARRDKTGAIRSFTLARQKLSEVKVVFPLNQEARVLELRIDQLSDPDEFGRKFSRMVQEARSKIDSRQDLTVAYSDLKDLEAINPRYPGLKALIERAEILLGFRQPPPNPRDLAEARSLVQAAQRIFDSGQVAQFAFARAQLEKAIVLDPNNTTASTLKDRIATYIGGDTAIVLSSAAETLYNEAVAFFTGGDYLNARSRLARLATVFPKGTSIQKVSDLDSRLKALGY